VKKIFLSVFVGLSSFVGYESFKLELNAEESFKVLKEEWTCTDCGQENPFWFSLCGNCGRFYW
jgi:hypothetical protein